MVEQGVAFFVVPGEVATTIKRLIRLVDEAEDRSPSEWLVREAELATAAAEIALHQAVCSGGSSIDGWVALVTFLREEISLPKGRFFDPVTAARLLTSMGQLRDRAGGDHAMVERAAAEDPDQDAEIAGTATVYAAFRDSLGAASDAKAYLLSTMRPPGIVYESPASVPAAVQDDRPRPTLDELQANLRAMSEEARRLRMAEELEDGPSPIEYGVFVIPAAEVDGIRGLVEQACAVDNSMLEQMLDELDELDNRAFARARAVAIRGSRWKRRHAADILGNLSQLWHDKLGHVHDKTRVWRADDVAPFLEAANALEKKMGGMARLAESIFVFDPKRAEQIYAQVMYLMERAAESGHGVAWLSVSEPWLG